MKRRTLLTTLLLATALVAVGCTTTMINPGTNDSAMYRFGRLTAVEDRDISTVYETAQAAMSDLGLSITQKVKDKLEAQITARDAQDKKIVVELASLSQNRTELKVKVGSAEKAQRIYQTIPRQTEWHVRDTHLAVAACDWSTPFNRWQAARFCG